ncbi:hypothetical protein HELRODRAFT_108429 [Helobdella robusta]|uniref:Cytochrome P450 n=1 Tax=Helobdella robusta TaxID=6412 RepID=T1EEI8_HELRO|nr:hypothetical protein HELRODRAFT_108429 [Helobdella robusta]ESN91650.1 hypothetical protein HELRODRAFT_108429 [Helobdella robusta]
MFSTIRLEIFQPTTTVIVGFTFVSFLVARVLFKNICRCVNPERKLPPCLTSLPIVGSLPFVGDPAFMHVHFMQKAKELGNVFAFYMCRRYVVVLNGKQAIQDAFVKQSFAFSSRTIFYLTKIINPRRAGIVEHVFDDHFKIHRRLSVNVLKNFGFGDSSMERIITHEVEDLVQRLKIKNGQPFNPEFELTAAASNVIGCMIFGKPWSKNDPEFLEGIDIMHSLVRGSFKSFLINFFPILRFLPTFKQVMRNIIAADKRWVDYIKRILKRVANEKNIKNFYTMYQSELKKMSSNSNTETNNCDIDHEEQLISTIRDLFFGGTETTATTLQWMILNMANNQTVQDKIWKELDTVVGRERFPSWEDRKKLPLIEAAILEVMRIKTLAPLAVPHSTLRDCVVDGCFIPTGVMVMPNIYSVHMDPEEWPEPETFKIERFLSVDKTQIVNSDRIIPFSLGKRSCLGESMARQELFFFTSSLIHQFKILPPEGQKEIVSAEMPGGLTVHPAPFEVRLVARY